MNGIAVLVGLAALGVDYGWQPTADGQLEYIIQIEPELLESLKNGDEIVSEILPQARGVRKFRIRVGKEPVPRVGQMRDDTVPRSFSAPNSGSGNAVLPPTDPQNRLGGPSGERGRLTDNDFRPDGRLNLPPPPPLLDADGKNSVLVRPGAGSGSVAGQGNRTKEVLPPGSTDVEPPTSNVPTDSAADPGGPGGWPIPPETNGSADTPPPTGPVLPPADSQFPDRSGGMVLPPTGPYTTPADEGPEVRPVPSPPAGSERPRPIRVGDSGVLPPAAGDSLAGTPERETTTFEEDVPPEGESMSKPTLDEETAEKLQPPWKPLVFTSLALFASLAANLYLGWVALGIYRRYREVVGQLHQAQATLT